MTQRQFEDTQDKLFIGSEWVAPIDGEQVPSINPATGSAWALAAFGGKRDIDRAVDAAREPMRGPWVLRRPQSRRDLAGRLGESVPEPRADGPHDPA
jgi:acyl-CoA reductase-like NAD-dependent aldehyde dehydrogenase